MYKLLDILTEEESIGFSTMQLSPIFWFRWSCWLTCVSEVDKQLVCGWNAEEWWEACGGLYLSTLPGSGNLAKELNFIHFKYSLSGSWTQLSCVTYIQSLDDSRTNWYTNRELWILATRDFMSEKTFGLIVVSCWPQDINSAVRALSTWIEKKLDKEWNHDWLYSSWKTSSFNNSPVQG